MWKLGVISWLMIKLILANINYLDKMKEEEMTKTNVHLQKRRWGVRWREKMAIDYFHNHHKRKHQEYKTHTHRRDYCMPPSDIYITISIAVAFPLRSGAGFVSEDKVTPRVADGRSGPAGRKDRGERRQRGCPTVTKCWGSEVREASALAWDIASLRETCCRSVCCSAFQLSFFFRSLSQTALTSRQRGSFTVS